jgi:hypothetical protein
MMTPALASFAPSGAGAGDCCSAGALCLAAQPLPSSLDTLIRRRQSLGDDAARDVGAGLADLADGLSRELEMFLSGESTAVRAKIHAAQLTDIIGLLEGIEDADGRPILATYQQAWVDDLERIARAAEDAAGDVGVSISGPQFDVEGFAAAKNAQYGNIAAVWDARITNKLAGDVLQGLNRALYMADPTKAARGLVEDLKAQIPALVTEARTETAAFDRYVSAEIATAADPDGDGLAWIYIGPVDGLQRKFCREVMDIAWTRDHVARLWNGVPGQPPVVYGGGYNCRHQWIQLPWVLANARNLRRSTDADVVAVNLSMLGSKR